MGPTGWTACVRAWAPCSPAWPPRASGWSRSTCWWRWDSSPPSGLCRLRLVVPVPEAYTAEMPIGTPIPFAVAAYPGQAWSGTIARIAQSVDVGTRTMAVELDVPNGD